MRYKVNVIGGMAKKLATVGIKTAKAHERSTNSVRGNTCVDERRAERSKGDGMP